MKLKYPDAVDVVVRPKGRKFDFYYWEGFRPGRKNEKARDNTLAVMRGAREQLSLPFTISVDDRDGFIGLLVAGVVDRKAVGNMLAGEFLAWSSMLDMPLRRIFEQAVVSSMQNASLQNQVKEVVRKMKEDKRQLEIPFDAGKKGR